MKKVIFLVMASMFCAVTALPTATNVNLDKTCDLDKSKAKIPGQQGNGFQQSPSSYYI